MKQQKIVAVGDCTVDTFIRLHDASVHCNLNNRDCLLCLSFADKVPYEELTVVPAVGNASNVAVGTARQGLKSSILAAVGDDEYGRQILDVYKQEGVDRSLVYVDKKEQTNNHFVLNFQAERTILIKQHRYRYHDFKKIGSTGWVYLSSLAGDNAAIHKEFGAYLKKHPKIKLGFNPATYEMKMGTRVLRDIYKNTYVLFINREEAQRVLKIKSADIKVLINGLHKLGPKIVTISDGPDGAYASCGKERYRMPIYPDPAPPLERTGAGDAFSSGFMSALIEGHDFVKALIRAPVNSMNVVQHIGAQKGLLSKSQIDRLLKKAPKSYKPRKI